MIDQRSWRVGVVFSRTGPTAAAENALLNGTMLAIETINQAGGVRGKTIEPTQLDPACDEVLYRKTSEILTEKLGISVIFGGYTSIGRKAMIPSMEKTNSFLFYPTFYEGFEYSDQVFYFGSCPNQYVVQLLDYMYRNFGKSFYLIGASYVFPMETNRIIKELLKQADGKVVGERYLNLSANEKDIQKIIKDIEKKRPDVIFSILVGDQIVDFYRAFNNTDSRKAGTPIASIVTTETEIDRMGAEVAKGHYCAASYFETLDTPASKAFVMAYHARFGDTCRANSCAEAAYNQVMVFAKALDQCGTLDADVLREAVLGAQFSAPQGDIRIDARNHHAYNWLRIGVVDENGAIEILNQSPRSIRPDPYLVNHVIGHDAVPHQAILKASRK